MVLLDTRTSDGSREIYSDDADGETKNLQPIGYKPSALAIELYSLIKLFPCPIESLHFSDEKSTTAEK